MPTGNVFFDASVAEMRRMYEAVFGTGSTIGMSDSEVLARYQQLSQSPQFRQQVGQTIVNRTPDPVTYLGLNPLEWSIFGIQGKWWLLGIAGILILNMARD